MPGKGKSRAKVFAQQQCTECIHPDHLVYADQQARAIFNVDDHKKYNGFMYFRDGTCEPMEDAIQVQPGERHLGKEAYDNFVAALETVNQQEYVIGAHTKTPKTPAEKQMVLQIAQDKLGVGPTGIDGKEWTPKQLAAWERDVKLRFNKTKAESYRTRLVQRSKYLPQDHQKIADEVPGPERWGNCKHPPIRKETAELLSQPPEVDFSVVGALLFLVAMFSYAWNLYGQINAITTVCSASYICPAGQRPNFPIPAPPSSYRQNAAFYFSNVDYGSFWPTKKQPCVFGTEGCDRPGYMIQWPYMQTPGNISGALSVPAAISAACPKTVGGEKGWAWDPFERRLRSEYYECSTGENDDDLFLPMQVGTTPMWLDKRWYRENNAATLECMKRAKDDESVTVSGDSISAYALLSPGALSSAEEIVGQCFDAYDSIIGLGNKCDCHEDNWDNWPFNDFHPSTLAGVRTKTCKGGSRSGLICASDAACSGFKCEATFDNQVSISQSAKFGCYFDSPGSMAPNSAQINVCGSNFWTGHSTQSKSPSAQQQTAVRSFSAPHISTRTMLLIVFAIKEGAVITAVVVWGVLRIITAVLYLLLLVLLPLWIYIQAAGDRKTGRMVVHVFETVDDIVQTQLDIVWRLCINLSTAYRIYGLVSALAHKLVNASIKDLDTKLTSVANLLYTLMLIFVRGGTPDATLVSGTALSLFTLLHKMNGESLLLSKLAKGFQDLNENRLTKFEFALFLIKAMEKFLSSDVQYNWVEHMVGEPDFAPDVHEEEHVHPRALDGDPDQYINNPSFLATPDDGPVWEVNNFSENNRKEAVKAEHSRELMPLKHSSKFGHDGLGQFRQKYVKNKGAYDRGLTATSGSKVARASSTLAFATPTKRSRAAAAPRQLPGGRSGQRPIPPQPPQQSWSQSLYNPADAFASAAISAINTFAEPPTWAQQQQKEHVRQTSSPGGPVPIPSGPNSKRGFDLFQMSGMA